MSVLQGIRSSYSLFGAYGVALVARTRLLRQSTEVKVAVSGIKHPVQVRLRTTDVSLLAEMLQDVEYDLTFLVPPRVIVDAGANIGITSVFFASKYPEALIVAVEPEPSNFAMLEKNAALYKNIMCVRAALWKNDRNVNLADPGSGHWGFQTTEGAELGAPPSLMEVPGVTVSSLMTRFGINYIDFLRIDIEGAEQEVFENALPWIDRVGVIGIELHDRLKPGCSRAFYLATKAFRWEFRRGETVFLGRAEHPVKETLSPVRPGVSADTASDLMGRRRQCAIVRRT